MLSQFPLSRLAAPLRRIPFWAQALAMCALFAIAGVAILDDYGVGWDEAHHRQIAITVADYTLGISEEPPRESDRYYGVAFDMPLLLLARALRLQDTRHIYLTRHLIMHLFFIAGGFACGMLAYRMLGSRWVALLAMLMFLLHPRLYAHSFFNVKDIPFAAMPLIALYLTHRAFRKDTLGAFMLCGIVVGLAMNMRPFGLMLLPLILVMRALDLWQASKAERKRILLASAAFLAAALATVYITHPYYWENPLRFVEGIRVLSQHPTLAKNLFMGEIYRSNAVPWNYVPVWFAITAPPAALLLGAIGCAAVCWQAIARPLRALLDRETRFRVLLLGCFAMPVAVVIILQSNIYNDWRHMYFLWAPFCLLAAVGLHTIANIRIGGGIWKVVALLPGGVRGGGYRLRIARRALAYGIAVVGLLTTLTAMAALHPYEHVYFNALVDTKTPGALVKRYDMDYGQMAHRQLLEHLLARYPGDILRVWRPWPAERQSLILPKSDRDIVMTRNPDRNVDFYLNSGSDPYRRGALDPPPLHSIKAYGSDIAFIIAPNSDAHRDYYRSEYNDVKANGRLLARSDFDIYAHNGALHYIKGNCAPLREYANFRVFLSIIPADPADLPADSRERGFESRDFRIVWPHLIPHTAFFDGKCITQWQLPDYAIARIATGGYIKGELIWRADIDLAARAAGQALYDGIAAGDYGQPVAQSDFDVYMRGNGLAYLKEPCAAGDADARFFLHIIPVNPADLPPVWREYGFENLDFQFTDYGAYLGDRCVAERELPDYAIERIRTGQFVSGERQLWSDEFPVGR